MQVFPLNIRYQEESGNYFKKKGVIAYEIHKMSNYTVR